MKGLNYQNAEVTARAQRDSFLAFQEGREMFTSLTANKWGWHKALLFIVKVYTLV